MKKTNKHYTKIFCDILLIVLILLFKVLVWHTKTEKVKAPTVKLEKNQDTNLHPLVNDLSVKGVVKVSHFGKELKVCRRANGCD
jgi:hypothetical protein